MKNLCGLLIIIALSGCKANQLAAEYQKTIETSLAIPLQPNNITIQDIRADTTSKPLKIPGMSMPGQNRKVSPALAPTHRAILTEQVRNNMTGDGPAVDVVIILKEAYQEFSATAFSEKERGYAQLTIELYDPATQQKQIWCSSNGEFFIQSIDATPQRTEKIYQIALGKAANMCLSYMKETLETQNTENTP